MKQISLLSIILAILFSNITAQTNKSKTSGLKKQISQKRLGKVKIIVLGTNLVDEPGKKVDKDLDIQPFRTYLQGKNFFNEMVYLDNGEFELEVPTGLYKIVLKRNFEEPLSYERAKIYVAPNKTTNLRIGIEEGNIGACDVRYGFVSVVESHNLNLKEFDQQKYYKYLIGNPYDLVIKYCQKQNKREMLIFKFALLTYKNLNIYADNIKFDKESLIVEAQGNKHSKVLVEIENCQKKTKAIKFNLKNPNITGLICKANNKLNIH